MALLNVANLQKFFPVHGGILYRQIATVRAVDDVSFTVDKGETLGLVGESGCGKSTVGRTLLRLYDPTGGQVHFDGRNLATMDKKELRRTRRELSIIFQDPYESLNSRHTVGHILEEPFIIHEPAMNAKERLRHVTELLDRVGLQRDAIHKFPHEFSGGQRQRIGIARAVALRPKLIVCDEPVSALDVSIQSQILNLLLELQLELDLAYLFIAHDLAVVKHISHRIAVMYLGRIVEIANAEKIYSSPGHPYTQALIKAIPIPDPTMRAKQRATLTGEVPSPMNPPTGCHFHGRCPFAQDRCRHEPPVLVPIGGDPDHMVACHFAGKLTAKS